MTRPIIIRNAPIEPDNKARQEAKQSSDALLRRLYRYGARNGGLPGITADLCAELLEARS